MRSAPDLTAAPPAAPGLRRGQVVLVFAAALAFNSLLAFFIRLPGYMDAYYYFDGAQRLVRGHGFSEPYVWNYLDDPARLPHPSHLYWMPLTSLIAALPMALCGGLCPDNAALFRAAQVPSVLLASLLPVIAVGLSQNARPDSPPPPGVRHWLAMAAAWFAIFAGYYSVFWANTDSFALYGVVGCLALVCAGRAFAGGSRPWFALAGALAGLAHLTRADGLLLAGVVVCFALWPWRPWRGALERAGAAAGAYLVVILPWLVRNVLVSGSLLAPGGSQALWLTSYNQLFDFPAHHTLATYLAAGSGAILAGKWEAVALNAQTLVAVQGWIALTPFIVVGLWAVRRQALFAPALLYAGLLYLAMTFAFTFPGPRGGLLHSGAALMPFFAAAGPVGLERAVRWVAARRADWNAPRSTRVFLAALGLVALALTGGQYAARVLGSNPAQPVWNEKDTVYKEIGAWLSQAGEGDSVVVINNPPGFYYHTGQPAVVVPNGGPEALVAVAERFGAPWVVLDANVPKDLQGLYDGREYSARLRLVQTFEDGRGRAVYLFEVALP
jgi:hypothetical protein